jgi:hypothetical protein
MKRIGFVSVIVGSLAFSAAGMQNGIDKRPRTSTRHLVQAFIHWSHEVRRAIVPSGRDNVFGEENYGNKFPGERRSTWGSSMPRCTTPW